MTKEVKTSKRRIGAAPFPFGPKEDPQHFPRGVAMEHPFYISGPILAPEEYSSWFDTIRNASPHDTIIFHINSTGGDLFTAIQFMRVMQESPANIIASVEGACMSAATLIFLGADAWQISDHTMFMFHNYSGGTIGKGGEMFEQLSHERKWSIKLIKDAYKGFLSDTEIDSILDNKDIWLDGEDVLKRLKKREAAEEAEQAKKTAPKPKKPVARTTPKPATKAAEAE